MSVHPKTKFILRNHELTPSELVDLETDEPWLNVVQKVVEFGLHSADSFQFTTSGSTGRPKSILHDRNVLYASAQTTLNYFELEPGSSAALVLPASLTGGIMMIIRAMLGGLSLHLYEPSLSIAEIQPVDFLPCTPAQFESLVSSPRNLDQAKTILLGGAPVPAELEKVSTSRVYVGYGMTETASHVALRKLGTNSYLSVGQTTFSSLNECLVIHAPHLGIAELATNDRVKLISSTSFEFLGRADFIINSGGVKIQPETIEQQLSAQGVEGWISSYPDEKFGQALVLVLRDGTAALAQQALSQVKAPVLPKVYCNVNELPTVSGKIDRKALEQRVSKETLHPILQTK